MQNGLTTVSASSFRTLGYISSGPICLSSSGGHKPDLTLQWEELCCPGSHLAVHLLEKHGKRGCQQSLSTSALSSSTVTSLPALLISWGTLSLTFLFLADIAVESLLITLCIPCKVQLQFHLGLPHHNCTTGLHPCIHPRVSVLVLFRKLHHIQRWLCSTHHQKAYRQKKYGPNLQAQGTCQALPSLSGKHQAEKIRISLGKFNAF